MKRITKLLRKNLDEAAPDRLADILKTAGAQPEPVKKTPVWRTAAFRAAAGVCAAAAVFAVVLVSLDRSGKGVGRDLETVPSAVNSEDRSGQTQNKPADDPKSGDPSGASEPGGEGGAGDEMYEIGSIESAVELPNGKEFNLYSFRTNAEKGAALLDLVIRRTGVAFDPDGDLSDYDSRPGETISDLILWGNLDAGMFYYQNMTHIPEAGAELTGYETWKADARADALDLASVLEPYIGKTELYAVEVLNEITAEPDSVNNHIAFFFRPVGDYRIDGCETRATLTVTYDRSGAVMTLRSDLSAEERYLYKTVTFGDDILSDLRDSIGPLEVENGAVCVTGWRLCYTQTIGLEDHALAVPLLEFDYTINGEGENTASLLAAD